MKNKTKKVISLITAMVILGGVMSGCGNKQASSDGKVEITIGNVPNETNEAEYALFKERVAEMNEKRPDVNVVERRYGYGVDTFLPLASSGDLPMLYDIFFTETKKIIDGNFAGDITKQVKERGYDKALNHSYMIDVIRDGKYYFIPWNVYVMGIMCNAQLFEQAGLVDENGIPLFPTSWEDLAEKAKIIQDKTGAQGFFMPTLDCGGWYFMNIAWAFGGKFEECIDGKWTAVYNSPEMIKAFQFVHDLKWKYDVLGDNVLLAGTDGQKLFAGGQLAMTIYAPSNERNNFADILGWNEDFPIEAFSMCAMPKGVDGKRKALMGGALYAFSQTATQEQLDACFDWLEICGYTPKMSEERLTKLKENFAADSENNYVIGASNAYVWSDEEYLKAFEDARKEYINVDQRKFAQYPDLENTILCPEEPYCCQDLYKTLDSLLQQILLEEDVDIQAVVDESVKNFQTNFLDKIN